MTFPEYEHTKPALLIKAALDVVMEPGAVFEVRIPKTKAGTISGYFNDTAIAATLIAKENGKHQSIYATANPITPSLLARTNNKFEFGTYMTASDNDITKRRWFLLDFDPVRPAGISSTDDELEATRDLADTVIEWLSSVGWPEPVVATSGNGIHVMYRTDDPNDDAARVDYEFATKMISSIFSTDKVKIDVVMFNASRVWKVYGTVSAKGSHTPDRPHRVAMLQQVPKEIQILSRDLIGHMASPLRDAKPDEFQDMTGEYIRDMDKWLFERGQTVVNGPRPMFGSEGQKWVISKCPFNDNHLNPMVGIVNGRPVYKCLHDSCSGNKWKQFREKIDPHYKDPGTVYVRLRDWCNSSNPEPDNELIQTAAQLGKKLKPTLDKLKSEVPRERILIISEAAKKETRRFLRETIGENHEKGNIVGVINRTRNMQAEGIVPMYWISDYDHRVRVGTIGDVDAQRSGEEHEIDLMVRFHSMGDSWVKQIHVAQTIKFLAQEYRINPLRHALKRFEWDGVKRLDTWLIDTMGAKDTEYTRAIGRKWLISAVARGMDPGCQADHMLIIEGQQGIGKSQALRILGGAFYTEYTGGVSGGGTIHKDLVAVIIGKMIVEMSELATVRKAEMEALKAMLTIVKDDARLSYERDAKTYPRTCVFAGTTNEVGQAYIADTTGARRFWPFHAGEIKAPNLPLLREARDQLWAEAVEAYESGEDWYTVPEDLALEEQTARQITIEGSEPWFAKIRGSLSDPDCYSNQVYALVPIHDYLGPTDKMKIRIGSLHLILGMVLQIDTARQSHTDIMRVTKVLKTIGFKKARLSKPWAGSTYAYEMDESAMPHLWSSVIAAAKSCKFPQTSDENESTD